LVNPQKGTAFAAVIIMSLNFPHIEKNSPAPVFAAPSGFLRQPATRNLYRGTFKPVLDKVLVILALPLVLPVIIMLALVVALEGGKPFYTQLRVGKRGKSFRMWKIRTMVTDADNRLEAYLAVKPAARREWDTTQKLKNDPRITAFGRFLRKTSLDELPQLFNVLMGTMSLVGARPIMLHQMPMYQGQAYFRLLPGITGLWQVSDRNNCSFDDRSKYDEIYGQTVSFRTDLNILFRTVAVVLRRTGC
jgi:lipopolysaccharide/colanic/teichoic acid biosynthesis glycosyltransferase